MTSLIEHARNVDAQELGQEERLVLQVLDLAMDLFRKDFGPQAATIKFTQAKYRGRHLHARGIKVLDSVQFLLKGTSGRKVQMRVRVTEGAFVTSTQAWEPTECRATYRSRILGRELSRFQVAKILSN